MSDVHSAEIRSYNMSQIHSKDTKPEELCGNICFPKDSDIERMMPGYPENQTSFSQSIKPSYLLTVAFGTSMKDASILCGPKTMLNSGKRK